MKLKDDSVKIDELRQEISDAVFTLDAWHHNLTQLDLVITSGHEPIQHSVPRSAHYRRDAVDVRNWYLKELHADLDGWAAKIRDVLGADFVVINEGTHFHIHWSPIYRGYV